MSAVQDQQLLPKAQVLRHQQSLRFEERRDRSNCQNNQVFLPLIVFLAGVFHLTPSKGRGTD